MAKGFWKLGGACVIRPKQIPFWVSLQAPRSRLERSCLLLRATCWGRAVFAVVTPLETVCGGFCYGLSA